MALYQTNAGDRILAADINQFYNILKGVAASGEAVTFVYNAAGVLIFQPSSDPAAGTELIQIKNNAGTVQSAFSSDGKLFTSDGTISLPGHAFESEKSTGFYRLGAGRIGIAGTGVTLGELSAASTSFLALGATPATVGVIRIPNATNINARNAANNADITILTLSAGNVVSTYDNSTPGPVNLITRVADGTGHLLANQKTWVAN